MTTPERIALRGARTHNLKGLDLDLPRGQLIVVTGPSGSGKSSLAFDTLAAEGQRRYLESLSAQFRQLIGPQERPPCDLLTGLPPTIAVGQDRVTWGPRHTLGTLTEVLDHLRVLFARAGALHCPTCGRAVVRYTPASIVEHLLAQPEGSRWSLLAPVVRDRAVDEALLGDLGSQGFLRVRLDGAHHELSDLAPPKQKGHLARGRHTLEVVIDRLVVKDGLKSRLSDSLETALDVGKGVVLFALHPREGEPPRDDLRFSTLNRCDHCELDLPELTPRLLSFNSPEGACPACQGLTATPACDACDGARIGPVARAVRLADTTLPELARLPLGELVTRLDRLALSANQRQIARGLLGEATARIVFLVSVGLDYLTLLHPADALSSGEASRVRLAAQLGPELTGVLYVLDEPTRGLHPADSVHLVAALRRLVAVGNTVIVVEHDPAVIAAADLVADLGPGAGTEGGHLLALASPAALSADPRSVTGPWLAGRRLPAAPTRPPPTRWLEASNLSTGNLKSVSVRLPINRLTVVTGVSGAGKSTLVMRTLEPALRDLIENRRTPSFRLSGGQLLDKVVTIDQAPIGRSPRSNPATFTKVFDEIRQLFAATKDAKAKGFTASRFSFNAKGGRCEACEGDGQVRVEMHFLPDVWVTCETCSGRRYNEPTLSVRYKGLDIAEVLETTVADLRPVFAPVSKIARILDTLDAVGLGYLRLGQPAQTLSGGESQRLKLAKELARPETGQTIYLLDEPSAGLHFVDLERLVDVLWRLVDRGNTVVLVDHRMALVAAADWVIELGPGGGAAGGHLLFQGTPADLAHVASPTGLALAELVTRAP
jgi:excinuclease ABC subunit A